MYSTHHKYLNRHFTFSHLVLLLKKEKYYIIKKNKFNSLFMAPRIHRLHSLRKGKTSTPKKESWVCH